MPNNLIYRVNKSSMLVWLLKHNKLKAYEQEIATQQNLRLAEASK
jgi:hypothetical protein